MMSEPTDNDYCSAQTPTSSSASESVPGSTEMSLSPFLAQDPLFQAFSTVSGSTAPNNFLENRLPLYMRKNQMLQNGSLSTPPIDPVITPQEPGPVFYPAASLHAQHDMQPAQLYSWATPSSSGQKFMAHPPVPTPQPFTQAFSNLSVQQQPFETSRLPHSNSTPSFPKLTETPPYGMHGAPASVQQHGHGKFMPMASGSMGPSPATTPTPPMAGSSAPASIPFVPGGQNVRRKIARSPSTTPEPTAGMMQEVGGTTYFYSADDSTYYQPQPVLPQMYAFPGTPASLGNLRPKASGVSLFFVPNELKLEFLNRHAYSVACIDPEQCPEIPQSCDTYHNLYPLEAVPKLSMSERPGFFGYVTSTYRATNQKDGFIYCLRRIHNYRLMNPKCLAMVEMWKAKVQHANVVQLREVFTTKAFRDRDHSLVFVYDFHAGAETLKNRHFNASSRLNQNASGFAAEDSTGIPGLGSSPTKGNLTPYRSSLGVMPKMATRPRVAALGALLPESLIWCYVVQLSSAIRTIHSTGLAARTIDPTKILIVGKTKLLINCTGIADVLTFEHTQANPIGLMQHYQQEDLAALGRLVLALACNSLMAVQRDHIPASIELVNRNYSPDLKNLILYLLAPQPPRARSVNDIMPMIGARFFSQLDAAQTRIDFLENELAKEVENGRLFRLLCKLGTVNERPEFNMDAQWSETGDRYLLKLFRDYLFHQVTDDGRPWIDMSHVVQCLNKLDAGVLEKIMLMSHDQQNVLVVSYADLKRCFETAFDELLGQSAALEMLG